MCAFVCVLWVFGNSPHENALYIIAPNRFGVSVS